MEGGGTAGREEGGSREGVDSSPWFIFSISLSADLTAAGLLLFRIQFCRERGKFRRVSSATVVP